MSGEPAPERALLSSVAAQLRALLRSLPGGAACDPCIGARLNFEHYETLKAARELILLGQVLAHPSAECFVCLRPRPVVRLRRDPFYGSWR